MKLQTRNRGLTLIELLVVIAILGLLAALLLPAVQAAREASRRLACVNNLKQLGLAVAGYEGANGCLPPCDFSISRGPSHLVRILPYLDQVPLYHQYNFDALGADPTSNLTLVNTRLTVLLCPSDPDGGSFGSPTHYAGSAGSRMTFSFGNGAFVLNPRDSYEIVHLADITDGTGGTVCMAEWQPGLHMSQEVNDRRSIFDIGSTGNPQFVDDLRRLCRDLVRPTQFESGASNFRGHTWADTHLYNHVMLPNERSCVASGAKESVAITAGSFHPGGANVLFLVGHVQCVRETINVKTWRALGSRNGGEIVSDGSY